MFRPIVWVLNNYSATFAAAGGMLALLLLVPQTAAILSKAGFSDYAYDPSGTLLRTLAFVLMTAVNLLLFAVVVPPDQAHETDESPFRGTRISKAQLWALQHSEYVSLAVLRALGRLSPIGKRLIGALLVALGLSLVLLLDPTFLPAEAGRIDRASTSPSLVLTGFGAWVFLVPQDLMRYLGVFSWGWRVPARLLLIFGALSITGQFLWTLPVLTDGTWSTLPYTLWGFGFLVFVAATLGRLVDAAAARTQWPVRAIAAAGRVALLAGDSSDEVSRPATAAPLTDADRLAWYDAMTERIAAMPGEGPVVLVVASGGGSRAAVFASLTYEALDKAHLSADPSSPTLGSRLLLISSVSGGSLASAWYQRAMTTEGALPTRTVWQNGDVATFASALRFESAQLVAEAKERFGSSPQHAPLIGNFEAVHQQIGGWPEVPLADAPWLAQRALVDDMGADFMAAVLRAVLEPTLSRGNAITRLWTSQFRLDALDNRPGKPQAGPLVLYNTTTVESGARYVVGLPRVPAGLFGEAVGAMDDPASARTVTAAEAARLSANFPFGFDVVRLPGIEGSDAVELLDGGIVDNTGIDTLARPSEGGSALFPGLSDPLRALDAAGLQPHRQRADGLVARHGRPGSHHRAVPGRAAPPRSGVAPPRRRLSEPRPRLSVEHRSRRARHPAIPGRRGFGRERERGAAQDQRGLRAIHLASR